MKKITLRELLHEVEFDYEIVRNEGEDFDEDIDEGVEVIKLIDLQGVYLGDIADFRVEAKWELAISSIIDRLEIYWIDYVITDLEEDLEIFDYKDWEDLYKKAKDVYGDKTDSYTILGTLINPELVYIEELENEV